MTLRVDEVRRFLDASPLFRGVPGDELEALARRCVVRKQAAGSVLFLRESRTLGVHGVFDGYLKMVAFSAEGHGFLLDVLGPGDWAGFAVVLRDDPRHFDLQADVDSTVVFLDATPLNALLGRHPEIYRNVALIIAERFLAALDMLRAGSLLDAAGSLAYRLTRMLVAHGQAAPGGGLSLPFPLSQEEMGQLVGITRQAVGRSLRKWARAGWVDLGYARIVIRNPEALAALATGSEAP
jgi:CRP-like cAMP-binding protein